MMNLWKLSIDSAMRAKTASQCRCRLLRIESAARQREAARKSIFAAMRENVLYTARELADLLGRKSLPTVLQRLDELAGAGKVEKIVMPGLGGRQRFIWRRAR